MLPVPEGARPLHCHPASPCKAIRRIFATARRPAAASLELRFQLEGSLDAVVIPGLASPVRTDGLWQHTCFEAFVGRDDSMAYCEFNLAPSSAWAAYRFSAYREGMRNIEGQVAPAMSLQRNGESMLVEVLIELAPDSGLVEHDPLRCGLAAVIEHIDGSLSYWALAHLGARPDFHAPEGLVLALCAGRQA
jgi:hypothetical protein